MLILLLSVLKKAFNFIKLHWKAILMALGVFFLLNSARGCYHKIVPSKPNSGPTTPVSKPLPKDVKEIIKVDDTHNTTTITNDKGTTTINGSRETTIEVKKDGQIVVKNKTLGFCLNPMLGIGGNNTGIKGIVAAELFYYKKLDLISGIGADRYISHTALFLAVGYTPQNSILHGNTSFWVGPSIDVVGGRGVMFGVAVRI